MKGNFRQTADGISMFEPLKVFPANPNNKRPLIPDNLNSATTDPTQLDDWNRRYPDAVPGVVTGRANNLFCVDVDRRNGGLGEWEKLTAKHCPLPRVPTVNTPSGGKHFWFRLPPGISMPSRANDFAPGIDVRGDGGYAIGPGSVMRDGRKYEMRDGGDVCAAPLPPTWLLFLAMFDEPERKRLASQGVNGADDFGSADPRDWLDEAKRLLPDLAPPTRAAGPLSEARRAQLERYVQSAITDEVQRVSLAQQGARDCTINRAAYRIHRLIRGADYEGLDTAELEAKAEHSFVQAVLETGIEGGEDLAHDKWSRTRDCAEPRNLSHVAQPNIAVVSGESTVDRVRGIEWPHIVTNAKGEVKADHGHPDNATHLFECLSVTLRFNEFSNTAEASWRDGDFRPLDDAFVGRVLTTAERFGFRPKPQNFQRWVEDTARRHRFHPIKEYLAALRWDGLPRIDTWLHRYLGAENSALNGEFGRVMLVGAVQRIHQPGCKFDTMLVLESPGQGKEKSKALRVLGGDHFTDSLKLGSDAKVVIEKTAGFWIVEVPDMGQMHPQEIEAVKVQITTQEDRARLAYGRYAVTVPRQSVFFGTTNNDRYLRDKTGNRRFLPVRVGSIDIAGLTTDRDQLWAEAVHRCSQGESQMLKPEFYHLAAVAQKARVVVSEPMLERLTEMIGDVRGKISKESLYDVLGYRGVLDQRDYNVIGGAMAALDWDCKKQFRKDGKVQNCFSKIGDDAKPAWLVYRCGRFVPEDEVSECPDDVFA